MTAAEVFSHVDHTLLKPEATSEDIEKLCREALKYKTASVCVNPRFVRLSSDILKGEIAVCTVIGFPLGAATTECKIFEAADAIKNGADEIDMVISIGALKASRFDEVEGEITAIKNVCGNKILKVIIEACLLTEKQKIKMCEIVDSSGADFIKTSTGFSTSGATFEDVALFAAHCKRAKIKAAGGVKSYDDAVKFLQLGASRLGSSSAVKLIEQYLATQHP